MKLSIITINYNNAAGLKKTLDSVAIQTYTDFEYIIVDGASTDESVNVIKEYQQTLISNHSPITSQLKWISEPDTSIYNAMNKGVKMATGEYTLMLNSGDYLVNSKVIQQIISVLDGTDIIQGNTIEQWPGLLLRNKGYATSDIDFFDVMKGHFLHQAAFCRRDLFDRFGMFDESYRIIGDTKFFMICLGLNNASFKYVDLDIANYDVHGVSSNDNNKWLKLRMQETQRMRDELFSNRLNRFFEENEKKIRLYNRIRNHKWIWYILMSLLRISNVYSKEILPPQKQIIK